jgi:hypothetical protein
VGSADGADLALTREDLRADAAVVTAATVLAASAAAVARWRGTSAGATEELQEFRDVWVEPI